MRRLIVAALFTVAAATAALADTLTLADGTRLEGKLIEQHEGDVVFEYSVGQTKVRSTVKKTDIKSLEQTFGEPAKPPASGKTASVPTLPTPTSPSDYPELKGYDKHVIVVLDRSGSMAIAGRFGAAYDQVATIISGLQPTAKLGVYLFDSKPISVFGIYTAVPPNDTMRGQLRSRVRELGINMDGYTDLVAGLAPAIQHRPDAIYLLSDGVATHGPEEAEAISKAIKDLLPKGKKLPIHVIGVFGGKHEDGLVEDTDTAREILQSIAQASSGTYREITGHWKKATSALKRPRNLDDEVEFHFHHGGNEFTDKLKELRFPLFEVEVRDHFIAGGGAIVEYANCRLDLKTRTEAGVDFDERKNIPLRYRAFPDTTRHFVKLAGDMFTSDWDEVVYEGALWTEKDIRVLRANEIGDPENRTLIKVPTTGTPTLEVAYSRGDHTWKWVFTVPPAITK